MSDIGKNFVNGLVSSVSGGLGSLATGAVGSLFGSLFGSDEDPGKVQHERNKELMELQSRYNLASQAQGYQLAQSNWLDQFGLQNRYNLPSAQVKRMMDAGINPYVSESNNTGQSSLGAASGATAPGVGLPSASLYDDSVTYHNFMDGISKLAAASGQTIQNASLNRKINAEISNLLADKQFKEAQTAIQAIERDWLPRIRDQQLKNMVKDNLLSIAKALALDTESALNSAKFDTEKQIQALNVLEREGKGLDVASMALNYYYLIDFIEERLENLRADTAAKKAGAVESRASAAEHTEGAALKKAETEFRQFDNNLRNKFSEAYANQYLSKLKSSGALSDKDYEEAMTRLVTLRNQRKVLENSKFIQSLDSFLDWLSSRIGLSTGITGSAKLD